MNSSSIKKPAKLASAESSTKSEQLYPVELKASFDVKFKKDITDSSQANTVIAIAIAVLNDFKTVRLKQFLSFNFTSEQVASPAGNTFVTRIESAATGSNSAPGGGGSPHYILKTAKTLVPFLSAQNRKYIQTIHDTKGFEEKFLIQ